MDLFHARRGWHWNNNRTVLAFLLVARTAVSLDLLTLHLPTQIGLAALEVGMKVGAEGGVALGNFCLATKAVNVDLTDEALVL